MNITKHFITFLVLFSLVLCLPGVLYAQNKKPYKRPVNVGISLPSNQTAYFNLGFLSNVNKIKGVSLNVITSTARTRMSGLQVAGIANTTIFRMNGIQLGGIANVNAMEANGLMIGGLVNVTSKRYNGLQFSGLSNITGKTSKGVAVSGLLNIAGQESKGIRLSGLANIAGDSLKGIDISGLMNVAGEKVDGLQLAGILNVAGGKNKGVQLAGIGNVGVDTKGLQLAGIGNIGGKTKGLQLAAITNVNVNETTGVQIATTNVANNLNGVQLGLVNVSAGKQKGLQIGLVNYSQDTTAHKLGMVNLNPKTKIQMMVYGGNTSKINLGVRFKNKYTYTILGIGTHYLDFDDKFSGVLSYRAGLYHPISDKWEISGDLGYAHIENFDNENVDTPKRMFSLQGRLNISYQIQKKVGLFASGGFAWTRFYNRDRVFERKPIVELGVVLF